jgi:hypothetical protein
MNRQDIEFISKAKKFVIIKDDTKYEFTEWKEAATFYNKNIKTSKSIELSAICGIVGKTLFYKYN